MRMRWKGGMEIEGGSDYEERVKISEDEDEEDNDEDEDENEERTWSTGRI